ncbi:MAG: (2Fe-2S) ferredoxin domain-containing protein [Deltaproteobacteria bacterium]|nr:MAG: (2Fe-2S) ferredoxin domain-containing protein [Deltaproteobacteria bacterium]
MSRYRRHFFVCQTRRAAGGRPSCGARGGADVLRALQDALAAHPDLWGTVQVTACGCLGPCFDGPTVVVYPEGVWYAPVRLEDIPELVARHLVGGEPVDRLRYAFADDEP